MIKSCCCPHDDGCKQTNPVVHMTVDHCMTASFECWRAFSFSFIQLLVLVNGALQSS